MTKKNLLKRHFMAVALLVNLVLPGGTTPSLASAAPRSSAPTLGSEVVVGAFRIHVQLQVQRVKVMPIKGKHAASVPSTQLVGQFVGWDEGSRTASISIAVENTGTKTLYSPLRAVITKVAPPTVMAANADSGTGPGSWRWDYDAALLGGDSLLSPAEVSGAKSWDFTSPTAMDFQLEVRILAGVPLAPGEGGTIEGEGGTSITVQPNSIPYEVLIDIAPAPPSAVVAPIGDLELAGAVEVAFQPAAFNASLLPPSAPLEISIPAPSGMPAGSQFIVGQQVLSDFVGDDNVGLREQLVAVDTASLVDGNIVTEPHIFSGIFGGGLFAFLFFGEAGFATGTVSDATGARPGAVVSNNTNTLVSITDAAGGYTLPISRGLLASVTAFDPFRGSSGSTRVSIITRGSTVTANIFLTPLATPPITRDGIRNGGFERGDLTSWATTGAASARQQLVCTGATIQPTEAQWMADINTGSGSVGGTGSSLKQRFIVPAGVQTLRLDFNFVSEEFPEFVGTIFNDAFRASITTPNGETTFAQVSVNDSGGFTLIGDCSFPGGDSTSGMTGWRMGSVDVSAFAGTNTPIQVDLLFTANDAGDNIFDTHVLIDNIRFSTVWIDAKILQGPTISANANLARIQNEVRQANEILSQAGVNVRIRNVQTVNVTNALVDVNITWITGANCADGRVNGQLTAEETAVLGLARSATNTDVNVYYVRSGTGLAGVGGFALGPDDFCLAITILNNSGTLQMDIGAGGNILAHELGHLLISPQTAGNALEHGAAAGNFLSTTPALGTVNRQQSANINRALAPSLVP